MERRLIINADDFGICPSVNNAVRELVEQGLLKSVSVIPVCDGAAEASFLNDFPGVSAGIHLTTTSEWATDRWKPLGGFASLTDIDGYLWKTAEDFGKYAKYKDVCAEINLQIKKMRKICPGINHADTHMGALYGIFGNPLAIPIFIFFGKKHNLALRVFSKPVDNQRYKNFNPFVYRLGCFGCHILTSVSVVVTPDYILYPGDIDFSDNYNIFRNNMLDFLCGIPNGISEIYMHPSLDGSDVQSLCMDWKRRYYEYLLLKDNTFYNTLESAGIELVNYTELIELKKINRK